MHTTYGMDTCLETIEILDFGVEVYSRYIPDICKNLEYVRHIPDICLTYDTIRIPDVQIHSFQGSEDRGKCNKTGNPSISDFSTNLTSDILILADSSHLPSDEAYRQCLSLPCNRLSTPCYECKPRARHFFDKIFINAWFCWGKCFYSVTWHL